MTTGKDRCAVDLGWPVILNDLGVAAQDLLRHARLPLDLFSRADATLSSGDYFRLWSSLEQLLGGPAFALRLGQAVSVEAFSPPIFASFCSADLNAALTRLAQYKPLVGPLRLDVTRGAQETVATLRGLPAGPPPPASFTAAELVFFVHLARLATRATIVPRAVTLSAPSTDMDRFAEFFGVMPGIGPVGSVAFRAEDARRPFLTASDRMWSVFEPDLRTRLADLTRDDGFRERVRACLLELLASGQCAVSDIAGRLAVSTRTLQRRLGEEGTSFQRELNAIREELAHHYLATTTCSSAEISFLLGYDDPNSFTRAFHEWTGRTPEQARLDGRSDAAAAKPPT